MTATNTLGKVTILSTRCLMKNLDNNARVIEPSIRVCSHGEGWGFEGTNVKWNQCPGMFLGKGSITHCKLIQVAYT
jgi:hypothetical protein